MTRKASAIWEGDLKSGKGSISTESGTLRNDENRNQRRTHAGEDQRRLDGHRHSSFQHGDNPWRGPR
jgi:hypothetical protein